MNSEQSNHLKWRYFGRVSPTTGQVFEIYRCPANAKRIQDQEMEEVQLLFNDGVWRPNFRQNLYAEMCNGYFSETQDELSEEEAQNYVKSWQAAGKWPGSAF